METLGGRKQSVQGIFVPKNRLSAVPKKEQKRRGLFLQRLRQHRDRAAEREESHDL